MTKWIIITVILLTIWGCSHISSGKYVQIKKGESIKSIAKREGIPLWKLKALNNNKSLRTGSWVFVPLSRGVIGQERSGRYIGSFKGNDGLIWPVPSSNKISSNFGQRWGRPHEGIDIPARIGAKILAVEGGEVVYSGAGLGGYGNLTVISHHDGLFSVYAHAKRNFTRKGQRVHKGQVIAEVGMTGRTTGPHLHFELRFDGVALDPAKLFALK